MRGLREEGFSVERAVDGAEGWHHLKTGTWDVILLDWWLLLYYLGSLVVLLGGFSATLYLLAKD